MLIEKVYEDLTQILPIISLDDESNGFDHNINKFNYKDIHKFLEMVGDLGEEYVYRLEVDRLRKVNSVYANRVTREPASNHENGYDILSFTENGEEIYIEVKSTTGELDEPFYLSENEYIFAKRIIKEGKIYQLHRVYNLGKEKESVKDKVYYSVDNEEMFLNTILYRVQIK